MLPKEPCTYCGLHFLISLDCCPHCGRPGLFPNVRLSERREEREALKLRYESTVLEAESRSTTERLKAFEQKVETSVAVIARDILETDRMASSDDALYSTYYRLIEGQVKLPTGQKWDVLREVADAALFGTSYKDDVRFAALSLDGLGLTNYGGVSWVLADDMIQHRASVFEENSVHFLKRHDIRASETHDLPVGYRAPWGRRAALSVSKLGNQIEIHHQDGDFSEILLAQGKTTEDDNFIEVHIGGSITVRSLARVVLTKRIRKTDFRKLKIKLEEFGVALEAHGWTP